MPDGSLGGPWNYTNAASFIHYTVNKGYDIHGWELGMFCIILWIVLVLSEKNLTSSPNDRFLCHFYLDSNNKYVEKKYFDKYVEKESDKYVNITFDNWLSYEF